MDEDAFFKLIPKLKKKDSLFFIGKVIHRPFPASAQIQDATNYILLFLSLLTFFLLPPI